ncbi:MerR family transcriptional regulator [Aurantimonas sp. A2-1-M11]|uniref:MerR family transcriptional regulator n=1 Tax=Aurantimonas sp. A2-1-M11 TaxID=3113712 RepID=UPI002F952FC3
MSDKSADAFRTISEVAEDLDLPQHVLRFWETRFQQIKPLKRGGGRRYYRPDDVELLRGIRYLLYVKGFTIKGVQRILKENGPRFVVAVGTGDMAALAQIQAGRTNLPAAAPEDQPKLHDLDLIATDPLPEPKPAVVEPVPSAEPETRETDEPAKPRGGFLRRYREPAQEAGALPAESIAALDDVILELLECKRLLDQVR